MTPHSIFVRTTGSTLHDIRAFLLTQPYHLNSSITLFALEVIRRWLNTNDAWTTAEEARDTLWTENDGGEFNEVAISDIITILNREYARKAE